MALIFCPECGTQMSEHAKQCNICSYPIQKLRFNNQASNFTTTTFSENKSSDINSTLIISGYVVAFLSLLIFPVIFLIAGIVIGIINLTKGNIGHGIVHIILSVIFGVIGMISGLITALAFLF